MSLTAKYDRLADGFSAREYADPRRYGERCAQVICEASPSLAPGGGVLDLACGDGLLAGPLAARGLRYLGIDASARMIDAARLRNPGQRFAVGDIERYLPDEEVATAICLRTFYQLPDRRRFFRHVVGYVTGTLVFDFRRSEFPDDAAIVADLLEAGFSSVELRPFLLPQRRRLPAASLPLLYGLERSLLAGPLTRRIGRFFCVARR